MFRLRHAHRVLLVLSGAELTLLHQLQVPVLSLSLSAEVSVVCVTAQHSDMHMAAIRQLAGRCIGHGDIADGGNEEEEEEERQDQEQ